MKKFLTIIMDIVLVVVVIGGIIGFGLSMLTQKGKVPNFYGYSLLHIETASMQGTIDPGDFIIVKKTDAADLQVGDIITFYSSDPAIFDMPNTHRIVDIDQDDNGKLTFITKGDNNPAQDEYPVGEAELIGRLVYRSALIGKGISLLSNQVVFLLVVIAPVAVMIAFEINDVGQILKERKQNEAEENPEPDKKSEKE